MLLFSGLVFAQSCPPQQSVNLDHQELNDSNLGASEFANAELEYEITIDSLTCGDWEGQIFVNIISGSVDSYFWIGPDSQFYTNPNPEVELPGNYILTMTGTDGCITRDTVAMDYDSDAFNFTVSVPKITCGDTDVDIFVVPAPVTFTYEWELKNDALFTVLDESRISVDEAGVYYVSITRPSDGCEVKEVTFVLADTLSFINELDPVLLDCNSVTATLNTNASNFGAQNINWQGPGITADNENDFFPIVSEVGEYVINGMLSNGCDYQETILVEGDVDSFITSYIDADGDGFGDPLTSTVVCEIPTGSVELAGDCNDQDPNINPDVDDLDENGIDENCDGVDGPSAIHTISGFDINIYPNPFSTELFIESKLQNLECLIYDMQGSVVFQKMKEGNLSLKHLNPGLYTLKLRDLESGSEVIEKIVKSK